MTDHVARLDGLNLVLPFSRPVTAGEWNGIQWPPCPKCGATICVDRVDVTTVGDLLRQYVAGRWECPNECDLADRAGKDAHITSAHATLDM